MKTIRMNIYIYRWGARILFYSPAHSLEPLFPTSQSLNRSGSLKHFICPAKLQSAQYK